MIYFSLKIEKIQGDTGAIEYNVTDTVTNI